LLMLTTKLITVVKNTHNTKHRVTCNKLTGFSVHE